MTCNHCTDIYTCILHRNKTVNRFTKGFELPHSDALLVENLVLLNKQLDSLTDTKQRVKLVRWITIVENMLMKKAA